MNRETTKREEIERLKESGDTHFAVRRNTGRVGKKWRVVAGWWMPPGIMSNHGRWTYRVRYDLAEFNIKEQADEYLADLLARGCKP